MKLARYLSVLLAVWMLSACSSAGPVPWDDSGLQPYLEQSFESQATVCCGTLSADVKIVRSFPGRCRIEFLAPETLQGLSAEYDGETVLFEYLGLSASFAPVQLPDLAFPGLLARAFDALPLGQFQPAEADAALLWGENPDGAFTLRLNREDGSFLSLEAGDGACLLTFKNFSFCA